MKTKLNFEDKATKELLSKLDFGFFLNINIEKEKYSNDDVKKIHSNYEFHKKSITEKSKQNKKQFHYYTEGQVRKMFTGGLLPAMLELDEGRSLSIFDFPSVGENWAYFDYWRKSYNRKLTKEKLWIYVTRTGSILAFALTIFKLYELIIKT